MIMAEIKYTDTDYHWKIFPCNELQLHKMANKRNFVVSQFISFDEQDAINGLLKYFDIKSNH